MVRVPLRNHPLRVSKPAEEIDRLSQLDVTACMLFQRDARRRRFPRLPNRRNAGRRTARMRENAAAGQIHDVERLRSPKSLFRLAAPLARRHDRHRQIAAEHGRQAGFDRSHDRIVGLAEFVFQSVDVQVIDTRQTP